MRDEVIRDETGAVIGVRVVLDGDCSHGYDGQVECAVDEDERTSCCGAYATFSGDGDLYCKCCYALVGGGEVVEPIVVTLR